jgi:hypothetical protein
MIFCTKCGGELKKSWKHCPSCGEGAAKTAPISPKNSKLPKETKINEDASPAINGVPRATFKNTSVDNANSDNSNKKLLGIVASIAVLGILVMALASNSSSDYSEVQIAPAEEVSADPEAEKIKAEKISFDSSLSAFLLSECKPTITKAKGSWENLDTWVLPGMTLDGVSGISTFPERYQNQFALSAPKVDDWGNSVDMTLMVVAAYEQLLAPLYYEIFGLWSPWSELGKFKGQFNAYFNKVDGIAKKLCYGTNPAPTEAQLKSTDKYLSELVDGWLDFVTWTDKVWTRESELSDDLDYQTTPRCTETKTNNPNYNIITCTNLP